MGLILEPRSPISLQDDYESRMKEGDEGARRIEKSANQVCHSLNKNKTTVCPYTLSYFTTL